MRPRPRPATRRALGGVVVALLVVTGGLAATATTAGAEQRQEVPDLHLVTLAGPGTAAGGPSRATVVRRQDAVLRSIDETDPTYRWTTALNGFAARLDPEQVAALESDPDVALVEPNTVVDMAATSTAAPTGRLVPDRGLRGGAGVVIGFVDSGIDPASPVFSDVPGLGRDSASYAGTCAVGEGWGPDTCNRKVVGAQWYVDGFGAARVRSEEQLSPQDTTGHGTQVASVAAGNAGVTVRTGERNLGDFGGVAPQARVAVYKACWSAPDPDDDGCATADVVTAIDRATSDRVDVLNLAVAGPERTDTVERALLGAAEADVVAVAAAGSSSDASYAAHGSPWVTTVGALRGQTSRGAVSVTGGPELVGASRAGAPVGPARAVLAEQAAVPGVAPRKARQCRPGTLDAALVADRVVVCDRGGIGRVDKSAAVEQVDGVAMVLLNTRPGAVHDDFHSVPTVHLPSTESRTLRTWLARHPRTEVRLSRTGSGDERHAVARWSASGDPRGGVLKPDVVARGGSVLGASVTPEGPGWTLFSGTSAATAQVSGLAALVRGRHGDWPATRVRSALATTATAVRGAPVLRQGAGRARAVPVRAGLVLDLDARDYRRRMRNGTLHQLNAPSLLLAGGRTTASRRITNVGQRAEYFSVAVDGFTAHRVRVTPLAVRLAPGESAEFRVVATGPGTPSGLDDGTITWRGARGSLTRIPVALAR